jgi:Chemoreceptor zinc-binding domain
MFGWLKSLFDNKEVGQKPAENKPGRPASAVIEQADRLFASGASEIGGLDFKAAIAAHMAWKTRLVAVIDGTSQESLQPAVVARDDQCPLGKWIHGAGGENFDSYTRFKQLCVDHAQFHLCASRVLTKAQAGDIALAQQALKSGSDYSAASMRVTSQLASLFVEIHSGGSKVTRKESVAA